MKKKILFVTILTLATNFALAQYFYTPYLSPGQNPSGLNTDDEFPIGGGAAPGWTTILAGGNTANTYSANRTIPFAFNFNGITESQYKVSNSGILTFDVATGLSPGTANSILPSILVPDKAICIWGIAGPGANDNIISKTFGTSPNRQHWISFSSYNLNNNWSYWSIVLEEGTDKIYIVDQRHQSIQSGLTLGIQINDTFAIQVANSPNIATVAGSNSAPSDNAYYEFTQGTQPDYDFEIHHIALNSFPNIDMAPFSIAGDLSNLGASTITSFNINYSINGGAIQTSAINSVSVPLGSNFEFSHSTNWNPTVSGMYTLKVWASNLNGNLDQNPGNDTLSKTIVISDSLPNIIDNYINSVSTNTVIGNIADGLNIPRDLDFHPDLNRFELWVINKSTEANGGSTVTYSNAGKVNQTDVFKQDGNAWHFMSLPSGIAFSDNGNFANSPGVYDANHNAGAPFTGPALWSSDPLIYAQPSGGNGSHLDMLHESPYSMGIAHEADNVFWNFDSHNNDIVRYDFAEDHGPGNDYHADAIVRRYPVPVQRLNLDVACHLVLDKKTNWLYIVDGGNQRILRLDITSGIPNGTPTAPQYEALAEYTQMGFINWEIVADSGLIEPSGVDIVGDRMLVSDHFNGDIIIYDISSNPIIEVGRILTGSAGIQGIKIGPDGFIWFVNSITNEVIRVEQGAVSVNELLTTDELLIYPNPSNGIAILESRDAILNGYTAIVMDIFGKVILRTDLKNAYREQLDLTSLASGVYSITLDKNGVSKITRKLIIQN